MGLHGSKRILCFGDSNTWGYIPGSGGRYPADIRWPGVLQSILGEDYCIIEDGLNGRTSVFTDPLYRYRNGLDALGPALLANDPLDMVILALGTNDLQFTDARGAARGGRALIYAVESIAEQIAAGRFWPVDGQQKTPRKPEILLLSPIVVHEKVKEMDPWSTLMNGADESKTFAHWYRQVAENHHVHFLNSAAYATPSEIDGIHMMPESHRALAEAVAAVVKELI